MDIINNRYIIEKTLEIDSESRIFRVLDTKYNKKRILRLFNKGVAIDKTDEIFEDFLTYTKTEHKNILSNFNLDVLKGAKQSEIQYFYTKEYIDDSKLLNYVDLTYEERIFVLESVLYAISYLHFKGIVYGNLSFSKIYISRNADGSLKVKLEDLATVIIDRKSKTLLRKESAFYVSGIESYNLTQKADIFSIGIIAYYLITGKDFLQSKLDYSGLEKLNDKIAKLISDSIHIDPDKRPKSVLEFWKKARKPLDLKHDFIDISSYEYLDFSSSFVVHKEKRNELLNQIRDYFKGENVSKTMFIRSKAGMGKSRFLSEIKHFSTIKGYSTFLIEAGDIGNGNYSNIKQIIEKILSRFDVPSLLIEKYGEDLVHLVPEYKEIWDVEPSTAENEQALKNRIISRLLFFIQKLSAEHSFIVMIDNVDKLTADEIDILISIVQSDAEHSPYLLLSANDLPSQFNEKEVKNKYDSIELKPFNYHDTVYYVKKLLNIDEEAKAIAKSIGEICHGNPRKIENIILFMHKIGRIKMSKQRSWKITDTDFSLKSEDLQNISLYDIDLDLFESRVLELSADAVHILKQLAVFSQQVDVFFALQFSGLGGKRFMQAIDELIQAMIVQKTTSDWGNYYGFSDYRLANIFYYKIPLEERMILHRRIAEFYANKDFETYEAEFDSYILHLIKSNQLESAIKALKEKAESKSKNLLYHESIEYYEYALSIINSEEIPKEYLSILESISNVYYRLGQVRLAEEYYYKLIKVSDALNNLDTKYLSYEKIIELYIFQNRIDEAKELIATLKPKLEDYGNEVIRMRFEYLVLKLMFRNQENERYLEESEHLIEYLRAVSNDYYLAIILLGQSYYYIEKYNYELAMGKALEAYEILKKRKQCKVMIFAYRMIGVIHLKKFDVQKSEEYLMKAYHLAEEMNLVWENSRLLVDVGNLYLLKNDYHTAKKFYQSAEKYASLSNETSPLMIASIALSKISLILNEQSACKMQLDKYADLFLKNKHSNLKLYYYENLLVKASMFLELRKIEESRKLLDEIQQVGFQSFQPIKRLRVKLLRILINYFDTFESSEKFDFSELERVISKNTYRSQEHITLSFLLDLAIDAYLNERQDIFEFAYAKAQEIEFVSINTSILYRLEFCHDLVKKNCTKLLSYIEDVEYNQFTYSWKIYCIVGDIQFNNKNYVNALANYIEARGQFMERMQNIPVEYRRERMFMDESLNKICRRITYLSEKLYDFKIDCDEVKLGKQLENLKEYELMMKKLVAKVIKDKEYKKYYKKTYENKFHTYFENWQKFIVSIDEDNKLNLEKLIKFLAEYSLAQYGTLFIAAENGELIESFSTDYQHETGIIDYISASEEKSDVYIENKTWDLSLGLYAGSESTKMFFPIHLKEKSNLYTRRQSDENKEYRELVGYVYLESNRVLHNINMKTYKNIKAYEPLISLLINDYKITKKVTIDTLTQTHVRSYVQTMVEKTIEKSLGQNLEFSVLMIDIDHFKDVNDTYGHTRGDEVLQDLASILKSSVRESDIVGRYGGEEFIVILNGLNRNMLKPVADKIRLAVDNAKLLGDERQLTISIGAASYPEDGKNLDVLIENADKALYSSKHNGRNMVTLYNTDIALSALRYDTLAGVLGISATEDDRRMNAIVEIMKLMAKNLNKEDLLTQVFSRILDIVEAKELCVVLKDNSVYCKRIDTEDLSLESLIKEDKLNQIVANEDGYFVDWNDDSYSETDEKIHNWNTYIASDLLFEGEKYGKIILYSTIKEHEFERNHYKFVSTVSPLVAAIVKDM